MNRETYRGECTCSEWESTFHLDQIPLDQTGDLETIAMEELTRRHAIHVGTVTTDTPKTTTDTLENDNGDP